MSVRIGTIDSLCNQIHNQHRMVLWRNKGLCGLQITPINAYGKDPKAKEIKQVYEDECIPNRGSSSELKTVFKKTGVVTVGNVSQIIDGAGTVILASAEAVKKYNLRVRARILSRVFVGSDPLLILDGVIPATRNALKKPNLNSNDIDLFEVNKASAVVVCGWQKTSGFYWHTVNVNEDACTYVHTLGATGAVLMTKLVNDLEYNKKNMDYKQCVLVGIWLLVLLLKDVIKYYHKVIYLNVQNCNFKFVEFEFEL